MIVTRLVGGLGNQMFQYVVGRSLAHKLGVDLKLEISTFNKYKLRQYELGIFNIVENIATLDDVTATKFKDRSVLIKVLDKFSNKPPRPGKFFVQEKEPFHFAPEILDLPDNTYLEGSWQCPAYFENIEDIIRQEFTLKDELSEKSLEIEQNIKDSKSFSLHIRRGDYVQNQHTNEIHGLCDMQYYKEAVDYLIERFADLNCFVFSDEPEWVKNNLVLPCPVVVVDHNAADKAYEDMMLLSCCNHHIIANSTFSWWGAWLGNTDDKIVITPKKWFDDSCYDAKDLIPENWIRL